MADFVLKSEFLSLSHLKGKRSRFIQNIILSLLKAFYFMDAVIRLHLSELTEKSISRIKDIFSKATNKKDPELIIGLSPAEISNIEYFNKLDASIKQIEDGNVVTFTMEELENYIKTEVLK